MKKHKLFIVSGHSGSGKSSVMESTSLKQLISYTTRPIREGEVDGVDYYFISKEEFNKLFKSGRFVERTYYSGNSYGLIDEEIDSKLESGHSFVIVDYNGAKQLLDYYDNCVTIMLHTDKETARRQMLGRGDSDSNATRRLTTYEDEIKNKQYYDYVVLNRHGHYNDTVEIIKSIIKAETGDS